MLRGLKKYAEGLIAITIALIIIFAILWFLDQRFQGNIIGTSAATIGGLASGQRYQFG